MKTYLHAYAMCQSMFCAIPCPWNIWDEDARKHMLLFLPVVGLVIGLLWWGISWLLGVLGVPDLIRALVLCAYPFLCTGFIHLDGFMDVTDAVKSCRDLPRRREILKDSHVGSFAVIGCVLLMLAQFSFFACIPSGADLRILIFIPVVSRCCSALAVTLLPPMSTSQYAHQRKPLSHVVVLTVMLCATVTVGAYVCRRYGWCLLIALAGYGLALFRSIHSLKGMNGDISGYSLTYCELAAVAVLALL